jgi:Fe2+ or Zn2+ uptake regulation protein
MRREGELEAAVTAAIWKHDEPVTVHTILDELDRDPAPAYPTVITVVERLRAKGWLRRQRVGRDRGCFRVSTGCLIAATISSTTSVVSNEQAVSAADIERIAPGHRSEVLIVGRYVSGGAGVHR